MRSNCLPQSPFAALRSATISMGSWSSSRVTCRRSPEGRTHGGVSSAGQEGHRLQRTAMAFSAMADGRGIIGAW